LLHVHRSPLPSSEFVAQNHSGWHILLHDCHVRSSRPWRCDAILPRRIGWKNHDTGRCREKIKRDG